MGKTILKIVPLILLCCFFVYIELSNSFQLLSGKSTSIQQQNNNDNISLPYDKTTIQFGGNHTPTNNCTDLDGMTTGKWNNITNKWVPTSCIYHPMTHSAFTKCMSRKSIGFYGDSTLKNIASEMNKFDNASIELKSWASGPSYRNGGGSIANQGKMAMWWTPSAYFQKPSNVGMLAHDDISIIGISVWDMGSYYRGVNTWFTAMKTLLLAAAKKRNGKPLYVMHLHHIYASKCELKHDTVEGRENYGYCQKCNKESAMFAFREALESAVTCVQDAGQTNIVLIDTFGVTNSKFAENRSDGVHFDDLITQMELQIVLAAICNGLHHHPPTNMTSLSCSKIPNFEEGRHLDCKGH